MLLASTIIEREDKEREISENIKKAISDLNRYLCRAKKMGLTVEVEANPDLDLMGKEVVRVKVKKLIERRAPE